MKRNFWLILATAIMLPLSALANIMLLHARSPGEVALMVIVAVAGLAGCAAIGVAWAKRF